MVTNVHERVIGAPVEQVGALLDRLGGPHDVLWPSPAWSPMVLDRPVGVGARGGHGPIRYRVTGYEPGRRVEFTFDPAIGARGTHVVTADPVGTGRTLLRHVIDGRLSGAMVLAWPLVVRWCHDAVIEDLFDRAGDAVGAPPARRARWSPWVRFLQRFERPPARAVTVPATPLLAAALPRVDWADAHAVRRWPGTPDDPQAWADAVFRRPPPWVLAALRVREAAVGLVGIDRSGPGAFDPVTARPDEVLLGVDERHLDFRASVLVEPDRVVLSTVVQLHNARGRACFGLVRRVHPLVVWSMLRRAAWLLGRPQPIRTDRLVARVRPDLATPVPSVVAEPIRA